jgi:hypothetical protein
MGVSRSSRIVAALAMAVLVAGCGGSDGGVSSTDETVATGGPGVSPATGAYSGKTSQGLPITFTVSPGGTISVVRFGWRARCEDGKVHTNTILLGGGRIRTRAFSVHGTLETGGIAQVDGSFDGDSASGTLSRAKGSAFGTNCVASGIGWHASAGSGGSAPDAGGSVAAGTYSGTTSQGLPITFVVSSPGTVGRVSFGWRALCEDGKVHTNSILLDGGPIRDRDFSVQGTLETGGVAGVRGRFEDGTASGTLWRAKGSAFGTNCVAKGIGWHALVDAGGSVPGAV